MYGGWFTLNASGKMTGTTWLEERGVIDGPLGIADTHASAPSEIVLLAGWSIKNGPPRGMHRLSLKPTTGH